MVVCCFKQCEISLCLDGSESVDDYIESTVDYQFQEPMKVSNSNLKERVRMKMTRRMITKSSMIVVLKQRTLLIMKLVTIEMYKLFC